MNSLNSILVEGNVVRDPTVRETTRGSLVCNFSIASNRFYKQDDEMEKETSFFDVEAWSKLAEACGKNCGKGRGVRVVGRLKQDRWTDKNGQKFARVKVVAEHVEFKPVTKLSPELEAEAAESLAASAAADSGDGAGVSPAQAEFDRAARQATADAAELAARAYAKEPEAIPAF